MAVIKNTWSEEDAMQHHARLIPWVYHRIAPQLHPDLAAEDYLQEGYIGLLLAWRSWVPGRAAFSTYASTCIANAMRMASRHARRHAVPTVSWETPDGEERTLGETLPDPDTAARFELAEWRALDWDVAAQWLTPAQQRVWHAKMADPEAGQIDLAARVQLTQPTVHRHLANARRILRSHWGDPAYGWDPRPVGVPV